MSQSQPQRSYLSHAVHTAIDAKIGGLIIGGTAALVVVGGLLVWRLVAPSGPKATITPSTVDLANPGGADGLTTITLSGFEPHEQMIGEIIFPAGVVVDSDPFVVDAQGGSVTEGDVFALLLLWAFIGSPEKITFRFTGASGKHADATVHFINIPAQAGRYSGQFRFMGLRA